MHGKLLLMALALGLAGFAPAAEANHGFGHGGHGAMMGGARGLMFPALIRGADLTPEQQTKVQAILDAHHPKLKQLFTDLRTANEALADKLFVTSTVKSADLETQVQQVVQLRTQLVREGLAVALEVRGVLTPEQLAKVVSVRQQLETLRGQMRQLLGKPLDVQVDTP